MSNKRYYPNGNNQLGMGALMEQQHRYPNNGSRNFAGGYFNNMQQQGTLMPQLNSIVISNSQYHDLSKLGIAQKRSTKCRNPCRGNRCGDCGGCALYQKAFSSYRGIRDEAANILCQDKIKVISPEHVLLYDFTTIQAVPGAVGATFIPGISQVIVFTPATFGIFSNTRASLRVTTLDTAAQYPLPAEMTDGSIAIYLPNGSGVGSVTEAGSWFGISGVTIANLTTYSTVVYPTPASVPVASMNTLWRASQIPTVGEKVFYNTDTFMMTSDWQVAAKNLKLASSTAAPVPAVLQVVSIVPGTSWQLAQTTIQNYEFMKLIYIRSRRSGGKSCGWCSWNKNRGCGGSRCGNDVISFGLHSGSKHVDIDGRSDHFHNHMTDAEILRDVIVNGSEAYDALTIDPNSKRIVIGEYSDNLVKCDKSQLKAALQKARKMHEQLSSGWDERDMIVRHDVNSDTSSILGSSLVRKSNAMLKSSVVAHLSEIKKARKIGTKVTSDASSIKKAPLPNADGSLPSVASIRYNVRRENRRALLQQAQQEAGQQQQQSNVWDGGAFEK